MNKGQRINLFSLFLVAISRQFVHFSSPLNKKKQLNEFILEEAKKRNSQLLEFGLYHTTRL